MKKIAYVEDGDWGEILLEVFSNGFGDEVEVTLFTDFESLKDRMESGGYKPDGFIFDNEIAGSRITGVDMALSLANNHAKSEGEKPLIANLLCSNPAVVIFKWGKILSESGIPVLNKLTEAVFCGFWLSHCLEKNNRIPYQEWVQKQGIEDLSKVDYRNALRIQSILIAIIDRRESEGVFCMGLRNFLDCKKVQIEGKVKNEGMEGKKILKALGLLQPQGLERKS